MLRELAYISMRDSQNQVHLQPLVSALWLSLQHSSERFQNQKNPRAHKNKIGTPPPPKPPPKKEEFYGHRFSCRKNAFFPGVHKIGAAISGPRIADTNFTDTGIFLTEILLCGIVGRTTCPWGDYEEFNYNEPMRVS